MNNGDIKKLVKTGDEFDLPAAVYNRWQRNSDWAEGQQRKKPTPSNDPGELSQITVSVKNTTSGLIDKGGVVGLNTLLIPPVDDTDTKVISFEAAAPTQTNADRRQIAILAGPLNATDGSATAYVSGIFPAKVNVVATTDLYAYVIAGTSANLKSHSAYGEYRIVWPAASTGVQWVLCTPGGKQPLLGKITTAASGGGKYNAKLFGPPTTTPSASGNLAESDLGVLPGSDNTLFEAINEVAATTHIWTTGGKTPYFLGDYVTRTSDGLIVVRGIPFPATTCT